MNHYDIIGDIHGYADTLRALLAKLGYTERAGVYRHAERIAVFVGDFIDRGPKIRETLRIVRAMADSGIALAVLGNHEWNALRYHPGN
jgi:predicted MPP superfamily phosphohydrolase